MKKAQNSENVNMKDTMPNLIFMDIRMHELNGIEATKNNKKFRTRC